MPFRFCHTTCPPLPLSSATGGKALGSRVEPPVAVSIASRWREILPLALTTAFSSGACAGSAAEEEDLAFSPPRPALTTALPPSNAAVCTEEARDFSPPRPALITAFPSPGATNLEDDTAPSLTPLERATVTPPSSGTTGYFVKDRLLGFTNAFCSPLATDRPAEDFLVFCNCIAAIASALVA